MHSMQLYMISYVPLQTHRKPLLKNKIMIIQLLWLIHPIKHIFVGFLINNKYTKNITFNTRESTLLFFYIVFFA